jgi:hypothetical protein
VKTKVVNIRKDKSDVYIGRTSTDVFHYGNPFGIKGHKSKFPLIELDTRDDAVQAYSNWLAGTAWQDVEPLRRNWILKNIKKLKGKKLGCFCSPKDCHGDVLAALAEGEEYASIQQRR